MEWFEIAAVAYGSFAMTQCGILCQKESYSVPEKLATPLHRACGMGFKPVWCYKIIDIGRPSRGFPVTPPGIRVRTTAVRLVKRSLVSLTKQGQRRVFGVTLRLGHFSRFIDSLRRTPAEFTAWFK